MRDAPQQQRKNDGKMLPLFSRPGLSLSPSLFLCVSHTVSLSVSLDISDGRLVWRKFQLGSEFVVPGRQCTTHRVYRTVAKEKRKKINENFLRDSEDDYSPNILNGCLFISHECC